jgi:hypothetical protein
MAMVFAIVPFVVLVIGILVWALASNPLVKDAGRIWFIIGSFFVVWVLSKVVLKIP